jgi:hypothetical protein
MVAAVAAIVLATAGACGWFVMHSRSQATANQAAPAPAPETTQTTPATTTPEASAAPSVATTAGTLTGAGAQKKPQAGQLKSAAQPQPAQQAPQQAAQATPLPTPAAAALPRMAPVAFNPKTLDPKQNTRLKLDVSHMPAGMAFEIEMNGRLLLKSAAGNKADYDTLVVPPGVHEFRVIVGGERGVCRQEAHGPEDRSAAATQGRSGWIGWPGRRFAGAGYPERGPLLPVTRLS